MKFWFNAIFLYEVRKRRERLVMWFVWHLIPKEIRRWVVVRAFADATTTPPNDVKTPDEVGYSAIMAAMS